MSNRDYTWRLNGNRWQKVIRLATGTQTVSATANLGTVVWVRTTNGPWVT